jgi:hypothetical protein
MATALSGPATRWVARPPSFRPAPDFFPLKTATRHQRGEWGICVDEKTGIQALERARPTTLGKPGQDERRDYEYLRHGTRCLIASRAVATGQVIGAVTEERKTLDFVRHIRDVVETFPQATRFHWVMDNLNTH